MKVNITKTLSKHHPYQQPYDQGHGPVKNFDLAKFLAPAVQKFPKISKIVKKLSRESSPENVIILDYPVTPRQRWGLENPHPKIYEIIDKSRNSYRHILNEFLKLKESLMTIPAFDPPTEYSCSPCWENEWIPTLDGIAIYGFIAMYKPEVYMEVGSGNSTKFARKAIDDLKIDTKIISIDPEPRSEIDKICDRTIRIPLENIHSSTFDLLNAGDILFIDSSHRTLMNSDVTAIFLDIIPKLKSGVIVEIHDILLPYDYPAEWGERWYSEQYLMAVHLLASKGDCEIILPNAFVTYDAELRHILDPLWEDGSLKGIKPYGYSFWFRIT